jgi:hypothetical protein
MSNVPKTTHITSAAVAASLMVTLVSEPVSAAGSACNGLPSQADLKTALLSAVSSSNGGLNNNRWATSVDADGIVCAVAFSGSNRKEQWLLSRLISAQKANTANGLSLPALTPKANDTEIALSTANLNTAVNPGGSLCTVYSTATRWIPRKPMTADRVASAQPMTRWSGKRSAG